MRLCNKLRSPPLCLQLSVHLLSLCAHASRQTLRFHGTLKLLLHLLLAAQSLITVGQPYANLWQLLPMGLNSLKAAQRFGHIALHEIGLAHVIAHAYIIRLKRKNPSIGTNCLTKLLG